MKQRPERWTRVALLGAAAALVAAAALGEQACSSPASSSAEAGAGAASSSAHGSSSTIIALASSGTSRSATAGTGAGPEWCPEIDPKADLPPWTPEGWVRPDCLPTRCPLVLSPDMAHMGKASPWISCGDGCLELVHDWAPSQYRFYNTLGASDTDTGKAYFAYTRDLGQMRELQTVMLPDNVVLLDVLAPSPSNDDCVWGIAGLSASATFWDVAPGGPVRYYLSRHGEGAKYSLEDNAQVPLDAVALSGSWWAGTHSLNSIVVNDLHPHAPQITAWAAASGGEWSVNLASAKGVLFFSTENDHVAFQSYAWDQKEGLRTMLSRPHAADGGTGSLASDGHDMVWLEGSGYDAATDSYGTITLMTSPFATHAADLKPRALRTLHQNVPYGATPRVGGGYVLLWEDRSATDYIVTVTRLSDGAYWVLQPPPGGYYLAWDLYVTATEVANVIGPPPGTFQDGGVGYGEAWTIHRQTIASLGPPTMP